MTERPGHRKRFFAVCMVIVEAPRVGALGAAEDFTQGAPVDAIVARRSVASSDAITDAAATGATSLSCT